MGRVPVLQDYIIHIDMDKRGIRVQHRPQECGQILLAEGWAIGYPQGSTVYSGWEKLGEEMEKAIFFSQSFGCNGIEKKVFNINYD